MSRYDVVVEVHREVCGCEKSGDWCHSFRLLRDLLDVGIAHGRAAERADVVAWLRVVADRDNAGRHDHRASAYFLADAIERGAHQREGGKP